MICLGRILLHSVMLLSISAPIRAQTSDDPGVLGTGHAMIEVDVYHTLYRDAGVRTETLNVAPVLVTYGLNERTDFGIGFDSYYRERVKNAGTTAETSDWRDITLRCKYSLWGHDRPEPSAGDTAFALLPYLKLPLKWGDAGSDLVEGGLIFPFSVILPSDFLIVVMTEFDAVADTTDTRHEFQWIESVVLSRAFSEKISAYIELYSVMPAEAALDWSLQTNFGVYYAFTPDFYLDCGCNFGVTRSAPDFEPFVGITYIY
jgi:hypothetical protein